jgi:hypothetical protein
MKNFTKKRGFFAVSAALLIVTAMLVTTWCSNDIGNDTDEFTPPPGKGAVKLSFEKEIARTILPDHADLDSFTKFDFVFTSAGGSATSYTEYNILPANLGDPITLDPGNYTLIVLAYIGADLAAENAPAVSVTITAAKTTSAVIVLKPLDQTTATGNGIFKYKITSSILAGNITSAVLNLTPILAGAAQSNVDVSSYWNDNSDHNLTVKAGDYYLDFVINVQSGETVTFRHIVHIYQNMTSSYEFTINPNYFNAVFKLIATDLTYSHSQDKLPLLTADGVDKAEGAEITVIQGDTVTIAVKNGSTVGFTSYEWYSQDDTNLQTGVSPAYIVDTSSGVFSARKTYQLTVVGVVSAAEKYYTFINIKVVKAP